MADETTPTKPAPKPKVNPLDLFCKRSGYDPEDVDTYNLKTLVFATTNGGKYQMTRTGAVRRLSGPRAPKEE